MKQQSEGNMKNRGRAASMAPIDDGRASVSGEDSAPALDDRRTDQSEAAQILKGYATARLTPVMKACHCARAVERRNC
jgi:hypothetical protein